MMPFEQIPKGGKKVSHISFLGGGLFRQKKQMVQRSCRGTRSPYSRKSKDPIVAKAGQVGREDQKTKPESHVLILYCCIMKDHKPSNLQYHPFTISQFLQIDLPQTYISYSDLISYSRTPNSCHPDIIVHSISLKPNQSFSQTPAHISSISFSKDQNHRIFHLYQCLVPTIQ